MKLRLLKLTFILSLCAFLPEIYGQQPTSTAKAGFECDVFLDIYNGFYDWQAVKSYSGGQKKSSGDKYDVGAVTVANLNDTDGDGVIDNGVNEQVVQSSLGRNEVDLIKLVIDKKGTNPVGQAILKKISGTVTLWESPTKAGQPIVLNANDEVTYQVSTLPKTIYVEATAASSNLRDIEFHLLYNSATVDKVRATAVWTTRTNNWNTNTIAPAPNTPALPDLTHTPLVNNIDNKWVSQNMHRYGFQDFYSGTIQGDNSALDKRLGGRILLEFQVTPAGAGQLVKFDVTRQKKVRAYKLELMNNTLNQFESINYPTEDNLDNEKPNDDKNNYTDEDNSPSNNLIYSADIPSTQLTEANNVAFKINKIDFHEFVRIGISAPPIIDNAQDVRGSRGSAVTDWHCFYYTKRGSNNGKLTQDNATTSFSEPLRLNGSNAMTGNGTISISLNSTTGTEGYSLMYSTVGNKWTLLNSGGTSTDFSANGNGTSWTIMTPSLNIQIAQGGTSFANGDTFVFSTFRTQSTKVNEINLGSLDVTTLP